MRIDDISSLAPWAQKQILDKLHRDKKQAEKSRSKYGNEPVQVGALKFDSRKEARRYQALMALQAAGEISDLRLQRDFHLLESYTTTEGQRIRGMVYRADFTYLDSNGNLVVEDVKSRATKTDTYLLKKKLMREQLGIEIQEI